MEERLAIVASDLNELIHRLDDWSRQVASPTSIEAVWARCGDQDGRQRLPSQLPDAKVSAILRPSGLQAKKSPGTACILRIRVAGCPCLRIRFARERYWISDSLAPQTWLATNPQLHPLISCNSSTLKETRFSSSLVDSAFYALDHKINDEGVFRRGFLEIACMAAVSLANERSAR